MDVNLNTEAKVYGAPTVPVVEQEDKVKPQVAPVKEGTEATQAKLNEQALHPQTHQSGGATMSKDEAEKIMAQIQSRLDSIGGNLSLGLKEYLPTKDIVIQVRDTRNDKIIRQFPSEELLRLKARLEDVTGILFNETS
ncbi:MAG: flagellar protein FlaG [Desulfobacteraceae bacterium]|nr:flagellar protein FlaG [Desulfobacteraceae bacterium]